MITTGIITALMLAASPYPIHRDFCGCPGESVSLSAAPDRGANILLVTARDPNETAPRLIRCFRFSSALVCSSCVSVNNCGTCWFTGLCNAFEAQICNFGLVAIPAHKGGYTVVYVPMPCFYKTHCVPSVPCPGPCGLALDAFAFSDQDGYTAMPALACTPGTQENNRRPLIARARP